MRIAIVGSGISGLSCAHALNGHAEVVLYEAQPRLGGHTNTVDVTLDGTSHPVDTGFLVFNRRTYPNLIKLFDALAIPVADSDMSFGLSVELPGGRRLEWAGTDLNAVFAQRRNLLSPRFLWMLRDLLRFNRHATAVATGALPNADLSLGDFLDRHGYGEPFRRWYLLPMAAAIWSCPTATMLEYPVSTFVRFCHNHGLLQVNDRPQWYTVRGGARQYVNAIRAALRDVRLGDPVLAVEPAADGRLRVRSARGEDHFDQVVLASHSDESRAMLGEAHAAQRALLADVRYQRNRTLLHTDLALMPRLRSVWSSWNYLARAGSDATRDDGAVAVTYLLNRLQPLPFTTPLLITLNPPVEPDPAKVIREIDYAHPVFDARAIAAQRRLPGVQGQGGIWLAGAWTGYGFHEDGLKSGLAVAEAITARLRRGAA